ncbi:inner-membrane translocator [Peribacillus psychrosaccharolyticus]|uniref:inner-membrane translocator n=1 Tax=Peribacillus psychrosaccharolyticus TaxID=1407 RepID=UPI003D2E9675
MEGLILALFIIVILSLNIAIYKLFEKGKLDLIISGFIMMILAPVLGLSSGALFVHFYDWNSGGTGEGAGYGGAIIGLITLANGVLILVIGIIRWGIKLIGKKTKKEDMS